MPEIDYTQQIADVRELIEREKELGRLHSGAPSGIDGTPPRRISAAEKALLDEAIARGNVDAYQPPSAQRMEESARAMREISGNTIRQRHYEEMGEALQRQQSYSVDREVLRAQQRNLDVVREINADRGIAPVTNSGTPTSVDNSPAMRTDATSGNRTPLRAIDPPRSASPSTWQSKPPTLTPDLPAPLNLSQRIGSRPSSLPVAAGLSSGLVRGSAIGAGIDLGVRLISGQDPGLAAAGAGGSFVGSLAGAAVGSFLGPVGTFVGGMVGGYVGGSIGSSLFNALNPPDAASSGRSPDSYSGFTIPPDNPSIIGGGDHVRYIVRGAYVTTKDGQPPYYGNIGGVVWGSIKGISARRNGDDDGFYITGGSAASKNDFVETELGAIANNASNGWSIPQCWILSITPEGGGSAGSGSAFVPRQTIPQNRQIIHPASGSPHPLNSPLTNYAPNPTPDRGGKPTGDAPMVPPTAERLAPAGTPAGASNLGKTLPDSKPRGVPTPEQAERHNPSHQARVNGGGGSGGSGSSVSGAGGNLSGTSLASDLSPLETFAIPAAMIGTIAATSQPTGLRTVSPDTPVGTGNPTAPQTQPQAQAPSGGGTDTGANPGVCRFHEDTVSHSKLDQQFSKLEIMEMFQTAFQANMDQKLGPQLPNGGIAGKLGRMSQLASKTWNFLQVDRALAVFTWIGVLHNAYMLSNNLAQTLFSAIGNVLDAVGIQKVDEEGNESPYDVGEIVTKYTDNFGKQTFGVEDWTQMKKEWKAFNRIYQAATNILNSLQSITFSMVEMLEQISNYTGKIGNALRKSGAILQNSFNWMNPNANFTNNRFFNALNNTQEAVEAVDQIASEVVSIQQTARELADQKSEFEKAVSDAVKLVSDKEAKSTADSIKPNVVITSSDERKAE